MKNNILIIDDDKDLCQLLRRCIESDGGHADLAHTGGAGLSLARASSYQLVVLDVMLPDISGFHVLDSLRRLGPVPVLMLTARDGESDKITGLKLGADDYLTKPFGIGEFLARVQALVRRYTELGGSGDAAGERLDFPGLSIDPAARRVEVEGTAVPLTAREFDLLYLLASDRGRIYTKKQLYTQLWRDEYAYDDSNIMSFLSKLRKKLSPHEGYIETVRGVGYRFRGER